MGYTSLCSAGKAERRSKVFGMRASCVRACGDSGSIFSDCRGSITVVTQSEAWVWPHGYRYRGFKS
jgi:hypothetical protein